MNDTRQMRANTGNRIALGVLILLVALFIFICDCGAFGGVGDMVSSVFVGFFGLADFAYCLVAAAVGVPVIPTPGGRSAAAWSPWSPFPGRSAPSGSP